MFVFCLIFVCFNVFLIIDRPDSSSFSAGSCRDPLPSSRRSSRGGCRSRRCPCRGSPGSPHARTAFAASRTAVSYGQSRQKDAHYEDAGIPSGWGVRGLRQPLSPRRQPQCSQPQLQYSQPQHSESVREAAAGCPEVLSRSSSRGWRSRWGEWRREGQRGQRGGDGGEKGGEEPRVMYEGRMAAVFCFVSCI